MRGFKRPEKVLPMSSNVDLAVRISNLSKRYEIYSTPSGRLKQFLLPRFQRLLGRPSTSYFREFWALKNVSLEVKKGETVGVIGRNGGGKSTLLQLVCGTLYPTSGSIETHGRVAALLELGSGFNPEFTGRENVYLNASVLGLKRDEIDGLFGDIAAFADIGEFIEQPVKTYSSGMMVRLAFAVIAHVDADILVIDEALAVGDAFFTLKCMRFLRKFMETKTVLFVSHDTASIKSLCSRVVWLEKGEIVEEGSPKEVSDLYLKAFYEAQQGQSTASRTKTEQPPEIKAITKKDQRLKFSNQNALRNDIQLFDFDSEAPSFGKGGASIVDVTLTDNENNPLSWVVGGEEVCLHITVDTFAQLDSPIVGFYISDKLGQHIFGENTYFSNMPDPLLTRAGQRIIAKFEFSMPRLAKGVYSIGAAIADGTQEEHVQHHWVYDAVAFSSTSSDVSHGLIGVPMNNIEITHADQ